MGHIRIPHDHVRDPFQGSCPFHADCLEGLASGPAIQQRFGRRGETLADDDPFWQLETEYIASALANYILTLSPRIIVLGGGIMQRAFLYPLIRLRVRELLNGYVREDAIFKDIDRYIVPPALGRYSGVLGAIAMAVALENRTP
jgi:fructokinase